MSTPSATDWRAPIIREALLSLLEANASGRFSVEGFQRQSHDAESLLGNLRHVTVFYRSGQLDKARSGWLQGPFRHAMTFQVELKLAAQASADLRILMDPNATPQAFASALAASDSAAHQADILWDELSGILFGILLDPRNSQTLGGVQISDRWISNINKESPPPVGEYVLLTGTMDYTCTVTESVAGEVGTPAGAGAVDVSLSVTSDPTGASPDPAKAGAKAGGP